MDFLSLVSYIGTFVFALTGALKARRHQMDIFGAALLAFVTAYGGGTIRDILLGIRPLSWINDYTALLLVLLALILVFLFNQKVLKLKYTIFITDAIGLGLFTALGIQKCILAEINSGYAVILGTIGASFGGLLADILSNTVPDLLKKGELYATACLVGGTIQVLLEKQGVNFNISMSVCIVIVVAVRILSRWRKISLPEI
ncbi:MAG: trimeric intracellular cation channel family protein [Chitinophagaceae bacterium]|uniref:trimeric intracellular cation channel family protein n=1 Tax=unclassified Paraflavitalea TaxID=2798305 RepID=UPI003D33F341|nr:trimeric intracellular cation channel family protein [Chitinophagaceae bacterium]